MSDTPLTDAAKNTVSMLILCRKLELNLATALSKLAAAEQSVRELERDKERLEKVENHILGGGEFHAYHAWKGSNQFKINGKHVHGIYHPTFRQSLDAAMNKPKEKD